MGKTMNYHCDLCADVAWSWKTQLYMYSLYTSNTQDEKRGRIDCNFGERRTRPTAHHDMVARSTR